MIFRLSKSFLVLQLSAFCLLVAFTNTTDYGANFQYVAHVLSMDTTFQDSAIMWRALTSTWAHNLIYILIIIAEYTIGVLCLGGAIQLFLARREPASIFNASKSWAVSGLVIGFALWFFVFLVIAGEWFAMWQSPTWNGQESAFRLCVIFTLVLIFVCQPDRELDH